MCFSTWHPLTNLVCKPLTRPCHDALQVALIDFNCKPVTKLPRHPPLQVALIDLDCKPVSKLPRHAALDAEVLATAACHTELLDEVLSLGS